MVSNPLLLLLMDTCSGLLAFVCNVFDWIPVDETCTCARARRRARGLNIEKAQRGSKL